MKIPDIWDSRISILAIFFQFANHTNIEHNEISQNILEFRLFYTYSYNVSGRIRLRK